MPFTMRRGAVRTRRGFKLCAYCDPPCWRERAEFTSHPATPDGLDNRCNWCRARYRRRTSAARWAAKKAARLKK